MYLTDVPINLPMNLQEYEKWMAKWTEVCLGYRVWARIRVRSKARVITMCRLMFRVRVRIEV